MEILALEVPGSASARQRAAVGVMALASIALLIPVFILRDVMLPAVPGLVVFFIGVITIEQAVAAYLFFDQAELTGERAYLFLGGACEFAAVMGVGWAVTAPDALMPGPAVIGTSAVGGILRVSLTVMFSLLIGLSAVVYRRDRRRHLPPQRQPVAMAASGVAMLGVLWFVTLLGIQGVLPDTSLDGVGQVRGTYALALGAIAVLVCGSIAMVLPSFRTRSALHTWLILVLVMVLVAVLFGLMTGARYTVSWYATYLFVLVAASAQLLLLVGELRRMDRRRQSALSWMAQAKESADAENLELSSRVTTDPLTGLTNRQYFFPELTRRVGECCRPGGGERLAVVVIDFDGFKAINDRWGHATGDRVLRELGLRMRANTRGDDLVSRVGGDEFGLAFLVSGGVDTIATRLDRLTGELRRPMLDSGARLSVGCSVGYCTAPDEGRDPAELFRKADFAMYQAKQEGRGRALAFSATMAEETARDSQIRADAIRGISEQRMRLAYQPILDLRRGGCWGFEALVRMTTPDGDLVPAADFVDSLIAGGQVHELGWAVLDQLLEDLPLFTVVTDAVMSVNLSATELADRSIVERLTTGDLAAFAKRLVVDVAETSLSAPGVIDALAELRGAGVAIAVDDFGTGRSNMALLQQAAPRILKVDREFTAESTGGGTGIAVIRSAVSLAEGLGAIVVAEGVETREQEAALAKLGVQCGQGYGLGRPLTPGGVVATAPDS